MYAVRCECIETGRVSASSGLPSFTAALRLAERAARDRAVSGSAADRRVAFWYAERDGPSLVLTRDGVAIAKFLIAQEKSA